VYSHPCTALAVAVSAGLLVVRAVCAGSEALDSGLFSSVARSFTVSLGPEATSLGKSPQVSLPESMAEHLDVTPVVSECVWHLPHDLYALRIDCTLCTIRSSGWGHSRVESRRSAASVESEVNGGLGLVEVSSALRCRVVSAFTYQVFGMVSCLLSRRVGGSE